MERVALDRLRWKCRRGLLELDLVLARFLEGPFGEQEAEALSGLLELADNDLWEIVSGRSELYDPQFRDVVARLRAC